MHQCVVCGNSFKDTKQTRPGLIYHSFPRNQIMRSKWLKALGMDNCLDWHRVCSDHFLQEDYVKTGSKRHLYRCTIPQPYVQQFDNNGFLNKEKHIENFATTDDNISYTKPRIQTEQFEKKIPVIITNDNTRTIAKPLKLPVRTTKTKDFTFGRGICCSVKNCLNRHSKDLSFFGYPRNLTLRKKAAEKSGLKVDLTPNLMSRVCGDHYFDDDCFDKPNKKNRLRPNSVPSLCLENDLIEASNIPSSSTVNSGFNHANEDFEEITLLVSIDSNTHNAKDLDCYCCIPGCITNDKMNNMVLENVALFVPTTECVDEWSSSLGLQLTVNSIVCERHFRPQDILYPTLVVNGTDEIIKSLVVPHALPVRSVSDTISSETNIIPILRTYEHQFKRTKDNMDDEQLSTKKVNNVLDNTDKCSTTNISMSIDDFSCIESNLKQKLKNISANSSLSITLEPIENFQVKEPSVNSFSKSNSTSSMSITLQPKPKHNLTSTINNNSPSVNLAHSLPSTSSSSVYDLSQQCLLEHEEQEAISSFKMSDKLSSNSVIRPEFFDNQIKCLKPISPPKKMYLARLPVVETPVVSNYISLAKKSNTHDSNSDNGMNTSQHLVINDHKTIHFTEDDTGFIFEISKRVELPSLSWKIVHFSAQNETAFYQLDSSKRIVKEIHFCNSLVPAIKIFTKNYNFNIPITSQNQLKVLLKKIDKIKKCSETVKNKVYT